MILGGVKSREERSGRIEGVVRETRVGPGRRVAVMRRQQGRGELVLVGIGAGALWDIVNMAGDPRVDLIELGCVSWKPFHSG